MINDNNKTMLGPKGTLMDGLNLPKLMAKNKLQEIDFGPNKKYKDEDGTFLSTIR